MASAGAAAMIWARSLTARFTAVPIAPEELSTCSSAGDTLLKEQDRAVPSKHRVGPRHLLDLGDRLPDALDRRLRPPPERAPTKPRREHPPMLLSPRHPTTPAPQHRGRASHPA